MASASAGATFWRREAILVAAAIAVSIGTYIAFGEYFAFFGVLHAIALFSLLALPFLRAPLWLVALVAAAVIVAPFLWTDPAFINPWLAWIGFWPDLAADRRSRPDLPVVRRHRSPASSPCASC